HIPKEGLARFGECKRGIVATGEHADLDLRNMMKAGVLQRLAYEGMRWRRIGHLEAIVVSRQAEREISMRRENFRHQLENRRFGERQRLFGIVADFPQRVAAEQTRRNKR